MGRKTLASETAIELNRIRWSRTLPEERIAMMRALARRPRKAKTTSPMYHRLMSEIELLKIRVEQVMERLTASDNHGVNVRNLDK